MGLGKTLTMISLILRHQELVSEGILVDDFSSFKEGQESGEEDADGWISKNSGGTVYWIIVFVDNRYMEQNFSTYSTLTLYAPPLCISHTIHVIISVSTNPSCRT